MQSFYSADSFVTNWNVFVFYDFLRIIFYSIVFEIEGARLISSRSSFRPMNDIKESQARHNGPTNV